MPTTQSPDEAAIELVRRNMDAFGASSKLTRALDIVLELAENAKLPPNHLLITAEVVIDQDDDGPESTLGSYDYATGGNTSIRRDTLSTKHKELLCTEAEAADAFVEIESDLAKNVLARFRGEYEAMMERMA